MAEKTERWNNFRIDNFLFLLYGVWTVTIVFFLIWDISTANRVAREIAIAEAKANFNKDRAFRKWAASHGGVYVPATERTPPNPNLSHISERDITTPSGRKLTLMNPAYMVRQVMNDFSAEYGVIGRITSLKYLWEGNKPDEWERKALASFETGTEEIYEFIEINGEPYLRFIQSLKVLKDCLKCHGYQGYKEGDIRGGIGVSLPLKALYAIKRENIIVYVISHSLIWLLGFAGIRYAGKKLSKAQKEIENSEEHYRTLISQTIESVLAS
mgnify:CR=1 FL=1